MREPGGGQDDDAQQEPAQEDGRERDAALGIDETVRQLGATGRATWTAALIAWLSLGLGWAWAFSLLLTSALSIVVTVIGGWMAMRYFEHTRLQATRRQLARLGIGELSGFMPDVGSGVSTEAAADRVADVAGDKAIKKGLGVDITPP